ncbi:MAG: hypothetical protein IPK80_35070 [Nannocystis sp.]|nr:hypothetical protein [Nannocystis sp.]
MNDDIMIHNPMNPETSRELQRRICHVLGISPEDLALLRALSDRMVRVENGCTTVTRRCDDLQNVLRQACCPANMLYSQITINENSHKDQVNIVTPVTGLGDPYVDDFPIPPKKKIRLVQEERPGYSPVDITVALNLANNGTNSSRHRRPLLRLDQAHRPRYAGRQRVSRLSVLQQRRPRHPDQVPLYQNSPVTVGSKEYLIIEIEHLGTANNLTSAFASAKVNNAGWYAACGPDVCR